MKPSIYLFVFASFLLMLTVKGDTLNVGSANGDSETTIQLPFNFTNTHQIVGMQFDVKFPVSLVEAGTGSTPSDGLIAESREIALGQRRIVVFSPTNVALPNDLILNIPLTLLPASPSGGPTVTVKNIIFTNRQGQTFTPTLNYKALDVWRQQHFTETELGDANLFGDDKDPDGDGIPNLLEFLEGANPRQRQSAASPVIIPASTASGTPAALSIVFNVLKGTDAASLRVETSTDMQTWTQEGIALLPTGVSTAQTMEVRASVPIAGAARRFLRLAGTREPGIVSFIAADGTQQSLALDFDALDAWKKLKLTPAQLADSSKSGNTADPDNDGVSNLMEFYTGTDPLKVDSVAHPKASMTTATDSSRKLTMTFRASNGLMTGALNVQSSFNLKDWNNEAVRLMPTGESDATGVEFKVEFPATAGAMFLRLKGGQ